jgi:hypothetical protein
MNQTQKRTTNATNNKQTNKHQRAEIGRARMRMTHSWTDENGWKHTHPVTQFSYIYIRVSRPIYTCKWTWVGEWVTVNSPSHLREWARNHLLIWVREWVRTHLLILVCVWMRTHLPISVCEWVRTHLLICVYEWERDLTSLPPFHPITLRTIF